jgi:NAD-dependent histone deacetylase SIR2
LGILEVRPDDVVVLDDCDEGVRKLADALGWREELESMWLEVGGKVKENEAARLREQRQAMSKNEILEAEIEKLTGEVDAALKMSKDHEERVNTQLEKSSSSEASTSATPASFGDAPSAPGQSILKDQSTDTPSSVQSTSASEAPTMSEDGRKEPPSTPAIVENTPQTTEEVDKEVPAEAPSSRQQGNPRCDLASPKTEYNRLPSQKAIKTSHLLGSEAQRHTVGGTK